MRFPFLRRSGAPRHADAAQEPAVAVRSADAEPAAVAVADAAVAEVLPPLTLTLPPRPCGGARDAADLLAFMREEGWTGWMLGVDVVEAYRIWCREVGVEAMQESALLALVAEQPGCIRKRRRLQETQDPWLKRLFWRSLLDLTPEQRADSDVVAARRPNLYRIATLEEIEATPVETAPSPVKTGPRAVLMRPKPPPARSGQETPDLFAVAA